MLSVERQCTHVAGEGPLRRRRVLRGCVHRCLLLLVVGVCRLGRVLRRVWRVLDGHAIRVWRLWCGVGRHRVRRRMRMRRCVGVRCLDGSPGRWWLEGHAVAVDGRVRRLLDGQARRTVVGIGRPCVGRLVGRQGRSLCHGGVRSRVRVLLVGAVGRGRIAGRGRARITRGVLGVVVPLLRRGIHWVRRGRGRGSLSSPVGHGCGGQGKISKGRRWRLRPKFPAHK